jgi:hypothetical protein
MQGVIEITLGGVKRTLRFNNFAHTELSKVIFDSGHLVSNPDELLERLHKMASDNVMLLMKALVYAGMIGNDYLTGFKASTTQEEVGKWLAEVNESELIGIWETFLTAMGTEVSKVYGEMQDHESDSNLAEKKN